jgi:hypothetical protein
MVNRNLFFIIGGISAFSLYATLLLLLFYYFNEHRSVKHFVPKNTNSLEISIIQTPSQKKPNETKSLSQKSSKIVKNQKNDLKGGANSAKYSYPSKSISTLFKGVKVGKPTFTSSLHMANAPKIKYKPTSKSSKRESDAKKLIDNLKFKNLDIKLKSQNSGSGDVNAYMSRISKLIYNSWNPDALFAGLVATVEVVIFPNGKFKFRIVAPSDNQSFNESLIEYLNQLQHKGLPPHKNGKKLVVEIYFKPKE